MLSKLKKCTLLSALLLLLLGINDINAQNRVAVGLSGGTTGAGIDATVRITDNFNAKLGYSGWKQSLEGEYNDLEVGIDYDGTLDTSSFSLLVDYVPFKKFFRITAGVYNFNWAMNTNAIPNESYEIQGRTFSPERLGTLSADIEYENSLSPYLGFGLSNPVASGFPLKLSLDLGLLGSGAPGILMDGSGLIGPTADNADSFQEGMNEFEWYPVLKVGLSFAFMNVNK